MELSVIKPGGKTKFLKMSVSDAAFGREFNEPLVHQVVSAHLAGARQGSKAQKSRAAVRGGGRKPWRQKGTGRARAGTIRSPLWRGGGVTFAAKPKDHSWKVNRKMHRAAMRSIFSELARQERLVVLDSLALEQPKTALLARQLKDYGLGSVLIVTAAVDKNIRLAARNLPGVDVRAVDNADPAALIAYDKVAATPDAVKKIEEMLA